MAKNHFWKQFENTCARAFGGDGRFPANQGGALDFETPYAIGQCKTTQVTAKQGISVEEIGSLAAMVHRIARANQLSKWPVVCVKVRRGAGVRSEALVCVSASASWQWFGAKLAMDGFKPTTLERTGRGSANLLTEAVEALNGQSQYLGVFVGNVQDVFVAIGWKKFFASYAFKQAAQVGGSEPKKGTVQRERK